MKKLIVLFALAFAACSQAQAQHNPYYTVEKRCVTIYAHGNSAYPVIQKKFAVVSAKRQPSGAWRFTLKQSKSATFMPSSRYNSVLIEEIEECQK